MAEERGTGATGAEQVVLDLEAGSEWRFELEADENMAVRVLSPDPVFINSQELPLATWYPVHRYTRGALYAPTQARVEVTSLPASQYVSTSTTQPQLINIHLALERERILAKRSLFAESTSNGANGANDATRPKGPRVMVLGPPSSGKSTVVKSLVNMALSAGMGWTPGVISLDPASPSNLIPGTLSLSTPSHPLPTHHLAHPLGSPPASLPSNTVSADIPTLGWWFGSLEPSSRNVQVWRKLVSEMGDKWRLRCEKDKMSLASGAIVDTSSAFVNPILGTGKSDPKARYTLVSQAVEAFEIDTILVIGHEKLHIDLSRLPQLKAHNVRILRIAKSGGVVDSDDTYRELVHSSQVRGYFYGEPPLPATLNAPNLVGKIAGLELALSPYSFQIAWETLVVLRVGEENAAPSSALPLGSSRILSPTRLTRVDPSGPAHVVRLLNTVLAIVAITPEDRIIPAKAVADEKAKVNEKTDAAAAAEASAEVGGEEGEKRDENEDQQDQEQEQEQEHAEEEEEDMDEVPFKEEIGTREVLGFIVITAIDTQRKKYTVLSPSPGKLPSTVAIAGSIEWVDSA